MPPVTRRLGDDFLDQHPNVAIALLLGLCLLFLVFLGKTWTLRRDREAYVSLAKRLAAIRPEVSLAYAQGFLALGWLTWLGCLLFFGLGLWVNLFRGSYDGTFWVLIVWQAFLWAGLIFPYFYWPRWAMPPHARNDVSPFQNQLQRRKPRRP